MASTLVHHFYPVYFDFAFFFCVSPFRLKRKSRGPASGGQQSSSVTPATISGPLRVNDEGLAAPTVLDIQTTSWLPHKLLSGVTSFSCLFWLLAAIRQSAPTQPRNPNQHFILADSITDAMLKSLTLKKFWREPGAYLDVVKYQYSGRRKPQTDSHLLQILTSKRFSIFLCILYSVAAYVTLRAEGTSQQSQTAPTSWSSYLPWFWREMEESICTNLFNIWTGSGNSTCSGHSWQLRVSTALTVPLTLGYFQRHILSAFCELLVLLSVLTLWVEAKAFGDLVEELNQSEEPPGRTWKDLLAHLNFLQRLAGLINRAVGGQVTLYVLRAVVIYAITIDEVFVEKGRNRDGRVVISVVMVIFYFCSTLAVLLLAGDVGPQIHRFKLWLTEPQNRKGMEEETLQFVLSEIDQNQVALKGNGLFPVTYSVLAKMLSTAVIYFLICLDV